MLCMQLPFLSALMKHTDTLSELLACVGRMLSAGGPKVMKADPGLVATEKAQLSPAAALCWSKLKVFRNWLRGKRAYYQG